MEQPDANSEHRRGLSRTIAIAALSGATALTLAMPTVAHAEPAPPPPPSPTTEAPPPPPPNPFAPPPPPPPPPADPNAPPPPADPNAPPPPADPNAPPPPADPNAPPPPADPNAPPPPADPNAPAPDPNAPPAEDPNAPAPEPGRIDNAAGGFSYLLPEGWQESDATQLSYGQALLTKIPPPGVPEPPNDTSVLLGRLDLKLFAGAEADNAKAAQRLASDMGEFFMPFPGTRINQETVPLDADGLTGTASYYEVDFTDANKPNGQIWAGVVGAPTTPGTPRGQRAPERWFVVWLGSANNPVDKAAATNLANSIRQWTPPAAPPPPDPNAPAAPPDPNAPAAPADPNAPAAPADPNAPAAPADPNAPAAPADPNAPPARPGVGVPVPVTDAPPEMMPPA